MNIRSMVGLLVLTTAAALSVDSTALAFPKVGLPGSDSAASAPGTDTSASQDQLVRSFVNANAETILGQAKMAEALGLKDEAAKLTATAQTLKSSATNSSPTLKDALSVSTDAQPMIEQEEKKAVELGAPAKQAYAEGLSHYALGVTGTVALKDSVAAFQKEAQAQITSASILEKVSVTRKLEAGTYVATSLPAHLGNLGSGLKSAVAFAQTHNVPVPVDATKALTAF